MKNNDFSVPRRMSKSAFVVLLGKEMWSFSGAFLLLSFFDLKNAVDTSFWGLLSYFLMMLLGVLVVCLIIAFFKY